MIVERVSPHVSTEHHVNSAAKLGPDPSMAAMAALDRGSQDTRAV